MIQRVVNGSIQELVDLGIDRLSQMLRPRPAGVYLSVQEAGKGKASLGHYRRSLHQERRDMYGRIDDSGVVYGPWLEGTGSRNLTTRFKGYASFRRTHQFLDGKRPAVVQAHVDRAIRELNA